MDIRFLGTNGWYDTKTGNTTCVLIESKKYYIILDAGNGIHKIDQYIKEIKPVYLFLSHFHLDHIIGLHIMNKFNLPLGLRIFGQVGTQKILEILVNEPFTVPFSRLPYPVKVFELPEGIHKVPFSVECLQLFHSSSCFGYRFTIDGKIVTYCVDTGICENAISLAKEADLLIAECSNKKGQVNPEWPHLNPDSARELACAAGAKSLALVHFDANNYQHIEERNQLQKEMEKFFPRVLCAVDDTRISI